MSDGVNHPDDQRIGGDNDGLPTTGFLRLASIIGVGKPLPMSASSWWLGVKEGRFPAPVKLGPRTTAWSVEDIRKLIVDLKAKPSSTPPGGHK